MEVCRQGRIGHVVDSSCLLVGPDPARCPVFGRFCSQLVPRLAVGFRTVLDVFELHLSSEAPRSDSGNTRGNGSSLPRSARSGDALGSWTVPWSRPPHGAETRQGSDLIGAREQTAWSTVSGVPHSAPCGRSVDSVFRPSLGSAAVGPSLCLLLGSVLLGRVHTWRGDTARSGHRGIAWDQPSPVLGRPAQRRSRCRRPIATRTSLAGI
jgi:hypothetical protein